MTESSITFSWSPVDYDGGIKEYRVYRDYILLDIIPSDVVTYTDSTANVDVHYRYSFRAVGENGLLSPLETVNVKIPIASTLQTTFDARGLLTMFKSNLPVDFTDANSDVLIEYFRKVPTDSDFTPIINTKADEHTPANLTKSKTWAGYVVVEGVNYSSGCDDEDYEDLLPSGIVGSYVDYDTTYVEVDWDEADVEYKVKVTVNNKGKTIELESISIK